MMTATGRFPDISEFSFEEYKRVGYCPLLVSVFDHVLTEAEYAEADYVCYSDAAKCDMLEQYCIDEGKFISLYRELLSNGAWVKIDDEVLEFSEFSQALEVIVIDSLREKSFMDLYIDKYGVRVIGGYDRTDIFLLGPDGNGDALRGLVALHGLHII